MIILFEEYAYNTDVLSNFLDSKYYSAFDSKKSKIDYVGYYFNSKINNGHGNSVIIFPKVFLIDRNTVFGGITPSDFIDPINSEIAYSSLVRNGYDKFIFGFSTWLYRAIQLYKKRHPATKITSHASLNQVISNLDDKSNSELEIILSLLKFHREHNSYFTFLIKSAHSQYNKINWKQTIRKSHPLFQDGIPVYTDFITNRKTINFEEELLVLFYSLLNYLKDKYYFDVTIPENFELHKGSSFQRILLNGTRYLKKIRYKYFSDTMVHLWNLLYVYFEKSEEIRKNKQFEEFMLAKDFNIVFEDMIDDLIGDPDLAPELKNHEDGKQLDHIYQYASLILDDDIFYIGDSKYYKNPSYHGRYSRAKQFTYAKNIIQYSIDPFNHDIVDAHIRYRDVSLTEGYNITPNFFISAIVDEPFSFDRYDFYSSGNPYIQLHFQNRLFDRDTLFVQSYNINFLLVLSSYISKNNSHRSNLRAFARKLFRDDFIKLLNSKYFFYKLIPLDSFGVDAFTSMHFKLLIGKIYRSSNATNEIILALEKDPAFEDENGNLITIIEPYLVSFEIFILQ